jgi:hypothetical protein
LNQQPKADDLRGRIRLLPGTSRELIRFRTERLLNHVGKVPQVHLGACIASLTNAFRSRVTGYGTREFSYDDLVSTLRRFEGLPSPSGTPYVPPETIDLIQAQLARDNVVLLVGPPGIGKTALAEHLASQYRSATPPYRTVKISEHLDGLSRELDEHGPTVIIVGDPWGNSKPKKDSLLGGELPNLIGKASGDKRIIITTREDIYATVFRRVDGALQRYKIHFDESHYNADILWQIVMDNGRIAPRKLDLIQPYRPRILKALRIPKALMHFGLILKDEANSLNDCIAPYLEFDPLFETDYFDENSQIVDRMIKRVVDDVFGGNARAVLEQWSDAQIEHTTLFWLLCESGGSVLIPFLQSLAGEINAKFQSRLTVIEYARFLCETGIAEMSGDEINIHSYALTVMAELSQSKPTLSGQLVTNLARVFVARERQTLTLDNCYRALTVLNTFDQDLSSTSGWPPLAQDLDEIIEQACQASDEYSFAATTALTVEEWGGDNNSVHYEDRFVDGVNAGFMWRSPQSELTTLVRALAPSEYTNGSGTGKWKPSSDDLMELLDSGGLTLFLKRFFLQFIPFTALPFDGHCDLLINVIKTFQLPLDRTLRHALSLIENRANIDHGNGGYDFDVNQNFAPLLKILEATSAEKYVRRFPELPLGSYNPFK